MFFSCHARVSEWIHTLNVSYYFNIFFILLASFCLRGINHEIKSRDKILEPRNTNRKEAFNPKNTHKRKFWTNKKIIWTQKTTHKKIFWTHEIPMRQNFGPTKAQYVTMTRWHETHEIHPGTRSMEMIILFPILFNFSQLDQLAQANYLLISIRKSTLSVLGNEVIYSW